MRLALAIAIAALLGCSDPGEAGDAGDDRVSTVKPDGSSPGPEAGMRVTPHKGSILASIQLGIVYVGDLDAGAAPSQDSNIDWLVGSPYWLLLDEYGVGNGAVVGSARVSTTEFFQSGDIDGNGLVDVMTLQERLAAAIHGDEDAGTTPSFAIAGANAYLVYLPDGINVALGHNGTYTYQTCIDANGYHAHDGQEPYAVLPPCTLGRTLYAAAHELVEMATDPDPYDGWVSDVDIPINGGEIADICADQTFAYGVWLTQFWSNQSAGCIPVSASK